MRSILILLSLLLRKRLHLHQQVSHINVVHIASCQFGQVCRIDNGVSPNCIQINDCHEVSLSTKVVGTWVDGSRGNKRFTQYDITITNNLNTNIIKQIYIATDYTLRLRDHSNNSIWNVNLLPNVGILTLPSYQPSINAHMVASFTFGFIIEGTQPANLNVLSVSF
nr:STAB protein [Dictyostelium discoideum]